ncbi:MAG TPA: hypothetical protein VF017_08075 [Thermoanaerobaculia bacterium]|nr:hypothetical protein [Thermoanaerobaculia bacterium]
MEGFWQWVETNAPWLVPLGFVLTLTFLIAPVAVRNGYQDLIGYTPKFVQADKDGVPQAAPARLHTVLDDSPRLSLWSEAVSSSLSGDPRRNLATLLIVSIALTAAAMYRMDLNPLLVPSRAMPWVLFVGCFSFGVWLIDTRDEYVVPLRLQGLAERLVTPEGYSAVLTGQGWSSDRQFTCDSETRVRGREPECLFGQLFSALHGADPERGRITERPDWRKLIAVEQHFQYLARTTFRSLWAMVLLSSLAAALLKQRKAAAADAASPPGRGDRVLAGFAVWLLTFTLCLHGLQWFWLAENYGRLKLGGQELKHQEEQSNAVLMPQISGATTALEDAKRSPESSGTKPSKEQEDAEEEYERAVKARAQNWPFPLWISPSAPGIAEATSLEAGRAGGPGRTVVLRNVWPTGSEHLEVCAANQSRPQPVAKELCSPGNHRILISKHSLYYDERGAVVVLLSEQIRSEINASLVCRGMGDPPEHYQQLPLAIFDGQEVKGPKMHYRRDFRTECNA